MTEASYAEVVQTVEAFLPDPQRRRSALRQLLASIDHADSIAPNAWGVTLYRNFFRLNVGPIEVLIVSAERIRMNCVGEAGTDPFVGSSFIGTRYRSVRAPVCAFVGTHEEFHSASSTLQPVPQAPD